MSEEKPKYQTEKPDKLTELMAEFDKLMANWHAAAADGQKLLDEIRAEIKKRTEAKDHGT